MISAKKLLIASLVSAVVSLFSIYSSDGAPVPADGLKECIEGKLKESFGPSATVEIQSIKDTSSAVEEMGDETFEITVSGIGAEADYCSIRCLIKECLARYLDPSAKIQIKAVPPGGSAQLFYKGTAVDLDAKASCVDTLARHADGTIKIQEGVAARRVDRDAREIGINAVKRLELKVVTQQRNGKPITFLRARGEYRVAYGGKLTPDKAKALLLSSIRKYTGALRINDEGLSVRATSGAPNNSQRQEKLNPTQRR